MQRLFRSTSLALLLLLLLAALASASATWSGVSGPTWNGTNWVITGSATLGSPHDTVCVGVDTPTDAEVAVSCSGTTSFTCTITGASVANEPSAISWRLYASNMSNCSLTTGNRTDGTPVTNGTFAPNGTGPNAVSLSTFIASRDASTWPLMAVAVIGLLGLGAGLWWARNRGQAYVG